MAKVFRLQQSGSNTIEGWQATSGKYSTTAIGEIKDPNDNSASKQITSIPSPFARMDLVKTSFGFVAQKNSSNQYPEMESNTIYNQMVSHSLDVAQIFFQMDKWKDKIEIMVWDKDADLKKLYDSPNRSHRQLARTYDLYLRQDAETYNFTQLKRIYLLNYKHGPAPINIIGATSPASLFFCPANDLSYVNDIYFGDDQPFDTDYLPLYKRDLAFHKYWRLIQLSFPNFASLFPELNEYLDACYILSDSQRKHELDLVQTNDLVSYPKLSVDNVSGNDVEVLGYVLRKQILAPTNIANTSDFVISSRLCTEKPLVLPNGPFNQQLIYTISPWNLQIQVPYKDATPVQNRILPSDGAQYPYLTVSDFLEDSIICMDVDFNNNAFFSGNYQTNLGKSYLLPLTDLFFKYFSPKDLMGPVVPGGPKMLEMNDMATGVTVFLRIPIKRGYIEYSRNYYEDIVADINATNNRGSIRHLDFAFAMMSNIKYKEPAIAHYRLGLISKFANEDMISMQCYEGHTPFDTQVVVRNDSVQSIDKCHTLAIDGKLFDYVRLSSRQDSGVILPIFKEQIGNDQFTFAVDLGTTNTHIEYSVNGSPAQPFNITEDDLQIQYLGDYELVRQYIYDADFIPQYIGRGTEFSFPIRTILSVAKNADWNQPIIPLAHVNIPLTYEKRAEYTYNRIMSNIKWSNDPEISKRIQSYIEALFLILRHKVLLNNGRLEDTRIIWFYPISMTYNRYNMFEQVWNAAYKKYFSSNLNNVFSMTESVAPYEFFKGQYGQARIVTIDIGGGTSDIVIADRGEVKYITSFRFAANSIFGDAYADRGGSIQNGIIRQFKKRISSLLETNQMPDLVNVYKLLDSRNDSTDLASFFFSLCQNRKVIDKGFAEDVDFHTLLRLDDNQKVVFLVFYTAIIYHLASIMKAKEMEMPRYITFSGNGSKVISILSPDNTILAKYTKKIFEKVYSHSYHEDGLDIKYDAERTKEVTCKGGITNGQSQDYMSIAETKVVLKGSDNCSFVNKEKYAQLSDRDIEQTASQVQLFFNSLFELNEEFSFKEYFGINADSINLAKDVCRRDIQTITRSGLSRKFEEVKKDDIIEESLFFYPLVGILNNLASSLFDKVQN